MLKKRDEKRQEAAQMKFKRQFLGITVIQRERNRSLSENIVLQMQQYERKWLQHLERMDTNKIPIQALKYKEKWRRNIGRRKSRWKNLEGSETGTSPNVRIS